MSRPDLVGRRVLVTGAGGPAGVAVIRELAALGATPVGADCDPTAVGFHLATVSCLLPRADAPGFVEALGAAGSAHGCDAVISTVAEELAVLSPSTEALAAHGLGSWIPTTAAIATCVDKWAFADALRAGDVPAPDTVLGHGEPPAGPWIVKPRFGRGAQNVYATGDPRDLPTLLRLVPDPIVQTALTGREFSADCLVDDEGRVRCVASRWRAETRGGIATKGTTFRLPAVDRVVEQAAAATGITGTFNLQGFVAPDGTVGVVEINPRFSGALPLSLAAGADLVGQHLRRALGLPLEPERLAPRDGVSMVRFFDEVIIG